LDQPNCSAPLRSLHRKRHSHLEQPIHSSDNSVKEPNLNLINRTDNAVYVRGTTNGDPIYAMPCNDKILTLSRDDAVYKGSGFNAVFARDGDDTVLIGNLSQDITGGEGTDTVTCRSWWVTALKLIC
jgi:hypothetical protein